MKKKLMTLAALSFAGSTVFQGCFGFGGLGGLGGFGGGGSGIMQFLGDLVGDVLWLRAID